jgi:hypothetical protein
MVPMLSQSTAALARLGLEGRHRMRNRLRVHTTVASKAHSWKESRSPC